jgi:hypothetical protein
MLYCTSILHMLVEPSLYSCKKSTVCICMFPSLLVFLLVLACKLMVPAHFREAILILLFLFVI